MLCNFTKYMLLGMSQDAHAHISVQSACLGVIPAMHAAASMHAAAVGHNSTPACRITSFWVRLARL